MPELSIVVVTYNSADWVDRCLSSLPAGLAGLDAELIVVDNGSSDASVDAVCRIRPDARLLANDANLGFAAAVNQGARLATAGWMLLLNPDTECRPGALRALVDFAEAHPGHGIYGGRTLNPDGSTQPSSCWNLPSLWSTFCFAVGLSSVLPRNRLFDPESIGSWPRDTVREVGMVTGCLLLVPIALWRELDGLDERFFVYGEDADFAARATRLGYRPIITPASEIVHEVGASSSGEAKLALLMSGKITYAERHLAGWRAPIAVQLLRFGVLARAAGARLTGRGRKWGVAWTGRAAWWDGFPKAGSDSG